jgi:hypothetical protein
MPAKEVPMEQHETKMETKNETATATNWKTVAVARVVAHKADALWAVIRTGRDVDRILPGIIQTCRVEGTGAGARRMCGSASGPIEETILLVDDEARLFRYRIDRQAMMPLASYEGTLHVTDLGARGSEVLWFSTFELLEPRSEAAVLDGLRGLLSTGIDGIGALAAK